MTWGAAMTRLVTTVVPTLVTVLYVVGGLAAGFMVLLTLVRKVTRV